MPGEITSETAIQSLLVSLGDERRERIEKTKFLRLCQSLDMDEESGHQHWKELLEFCRIDDLSLTSLEAAQLQVMYASPEYNPEMASVGLMAKLKNLFAILADEDDLIHVESFAAGEWRQEFLQEFGGEESQSLADLDEQALRLAFEAVDMEGDGVLDFTEMCAAILKIDANSLTMLKPSIASKQSTKIEKTGNHQKVFIGSKMDKVALTKGVEEILADKDFGRRWLTGIFEVYPETRALFNSNVDANVKPVMDMLLKIIDASDRFEEMLPRYVKQEEEAVGRRMCLSSNVLHCLTHSSSACAIQFATPGSQACVGLL